MPERLDKEIVGEDNTPMQRVIICYRPEQEEELAKLLLLERIEKVVYEFDEFKKG